MVPMGDAIVYLAAAGTIAVIFLVAWRVSVAVHNASVADVAWPVAITAVAWVVYGLADGNRSRRLVLVTMATVWGVRLAAHLAWRVWRHPEDHRYAMVRRRHASDFARWSLWAIFGAQAVAAWVVALPLQAGQVGDRPRALTLAAVFGLALFAVGFVFETVADWQLARFRSRPGTEGRVLDQGLWAFSRHPNYFGEFCVWWGIFFVMAPVPGGFASVVSPMLMTLLLLRVTGVARTERTIRHRRPGYVAYSRVTNAFFPGPPRDEPHALEWGPPVQRRTRPEHHP